jgi:transposase-like protein
MLNLKQPILINMEPKSKDKVNRRNLSWLQEQSVEIKISLLQNHLSICQIMINELLEEEVTQKAGARYSREKPNDGRYSRWGFNPGSVRIGDQKLKVDVPRIYDNEQDKNTMLDRYEDLKQLPEPTEQLINGVLLGLSMRDYAKVIDHLGEGFGMSKSSISRSFVDRTEEKLKEFESRSLEHLQVIALFIDGKYLSKEQIIICMGVTLQGEKIPLGFVQTTTENSVPIKDMLTNLKERGLAWEEGLLCVIDGSKGIRKAIEDSFGNKAIIQRCQWHKQENILKYIPEKEQDAVKRKYQQSVNKESYKEARESLKDLKRDLEVINLSAARSLEEGLEDILTLHRLGLNVDFSKSFATTNCIENLNSQIGKYLNKVKYWKNSKERYRWIAAALLEIELKMRKVNNFRILNQMQNTIKEEIQKRTSQERISTRNGT